MTVFRLSNKYIKNIWRPGFPDHVRELSRNVCSNVIDALIPLDTGDTDDVDVRLIKDFPIE